MTQHDDRAYLADMQHYARRALRLIHSTTLAEFIEDERDQDTANYAIIVIGEAAASLSDETRAAITGIPWHAIIGMRNRLVHGYFDVDIDQVWKTIDEDLPALIAQLEPMLPELDA